MQSDDLTQASIKITGKGPRQSAGVFEKVPGSGGEWWIRYADAMRRIRREEVGTKGAAVTLYPKPKTEALKGKKVPERSAARLFPSLILPVPCWRPCRSAARLWATFCVPASNRSALATGVAGSRKPYASRALIIFAGTICGIRSPAD